MKSTCITALINLYDQNHLKYFNKCYYEKYLKCKARKKRKMKKKEGALDADSLCLVFKAVILGVKIADRS